MVIHMTISNMTISMIIHHLTCVIVYYLIHTYMYAVRFILRLID